MHSDDTNGLVSAALRALARDDAKSMTASSDVETRLRARVREVALARRRQRRQAALVVAAASAIVSAVVWRVKAPVPSTSTQATYAVAAREEVATDFLPLIYSSVPTADGQLVRVEVPRSALASFGLGPVESPEDASATPLLADVIVGEDGLARAVRFVRRAVH